MPEHLRVQRVLLGHKGAPEQIACVSIDMSPAFIKGVTKYLPTPG